VKVTSSSSDQWEEQERVVLWDVLEQRNKLTKSCALHNMMKLCLLIECEKHWTLINYWLFM